MGILKRPLLWAAAFSLILSGCSHVSYLWQAGKGQWALYNRERPLQEVIADPSTPESVRERLRWIPEIKKAVESELGVKATGNYTTYVDLKRPYVVHSITVAESFELRLKEWKFPFFGSFPYLGFFEEKTARQWQARYDAEGYDTFIRGVGAYSTLGYLRDPMLSTMLSRRKGDLVNLIFHESTHGQIYIFGEGGFNEQAASYVGDYGERQWIARTYGEGSAELKEWQNNREDRRRFGRMVHAFAEELKKAYAASADLPRERREALKKERFADFGKKLESAPWSGRGWGGAAKLITNNAALLAFLTYEDDQNTFDLLNEKCGGRLKDALRYLKDFESEWSRIKRPGLSPQAVLYERLKASIQ